MSQTTHRAVSLEAARAAAHHGHTVNHCSVRDTMKDTPEAPAIGRAGTSESTTPFTETQLHNLDTLIFSNTLQKLVRKLTVFHVFQHKSKVVRLEKETLRKGVSVMGG